MSVCQRSSPEGSCKSDRAVFMTQFVPESFWQANLSRAFVFCSHLVDVYCCPVSLGLIAGIKLVFGLLVVG